MAQPEQLKQAAASPVETDEPGRARAGRRALPLRRRLPRDALPRRRDLAAQRARLPAEARPGLERLRRLDHRRRARAELARRSQFDATASRPTSTSSSSSRCGSSRRRRSTWAPSSAASCCPARSPTASRARIASTSSASATLQDLPDRPALRHQRDQHPDRRALALLEAVHGGLHGRHGPQPEGRARRRGRRVLGLPADPLAGRLERRPGELRSGRRTGRCTRRRTRPTSCSPTAASTTTSGSRPRGSATRRSSSATAAARWDRSRSRSTTGRATPTACSASSTRRCATCASARSSPAT